MAFDVLADKNEKSLSFDSIMNPLEMFLTPRKKDGVERFTKHPPRIFFGRQIAAGAIIGEREYVGVAILKEMLGHFRPAIS